MQISGFALAALGEVAADLPEVRPCARHRGEYAFVSPRYRLRASGRRELLTLATDAGVAELARACLAERRRAGEHNALLVGALPFRADGPAHLVLPETARLDMHAAPPATPPRAASRRPVAPPRPLRLVPEPDLFCREVEAATAAIRAGAFEKVVLSRSMTLRARPAPAALFDLLCEGNTQGYSFSIDAGARGLWLGASPELLLRREGRTVVSHPLAGSIPRSTDPAEDALRARLLLRSDKDLHEHALVVRSVARTLRDHCPKLDVPPMPSLVATPTMWHLGTELRGELADPATSSLDLALALHPTPAVCGQPPAPARDFIARAEGYDRDLFTGLVGWCDASGDGEWAVTIRCAALRDDEVTLYAGAGIVAASQPERELAETTAKMQTMLDAVLRTAAQAEAA
ncbi:isochorismate synthase [Derxia gummosa]|uniref:isochorismate synthase n=1 Tax=Derxia gummosa DSM 723 TaxID=1121388 RepID=A0A8B6X8S1_9BURK|nr:isochorismate synthase [Derxia gummosa]